mgnify:CR=1 FL=1
MIISFFFGICIYPHTSKRCYPTCCVSFVIRSSQETRIRMVLVASTKMCACMILSNNGTKCFELKYLNLNQIWQKTNLHHWQLQIDQLFLIFLWNLSLMRLWLTIVLCAPKFRIEIVGMKWQLSDKPWQVGSVLDAYTLYMYIICYLVIQSFRIFVLYSNVLSFWT